MIQERTRSGTESRWFTKEEIDRVLAAMIGPDEKPVDYGISFAGTLFISWPLDVPLFLAAVQRVCRYPT